ncbi:MAG: porin [Armatimonadota bacterium]
MRRIALFIFVMVFCLALSGAFAETPGSTDAVIKALVDKGLITEADVAKAQQELDKQAKPAASVPVVSKQEIKLSGFVQERYTHSNQQDFNDSLETKRARLILSGNPTDKLDFFIQTDLAGSRTVVSAIDFVTPGTTTTKVSKPVLLSAVVGYKLNASNKLSIGQFGVPFGLENTTAAWNLDFINIPTVVSELVPGRDPNAIGYDQGIQLYGGTHNRSGKLTSLYTLALLNGSGLTTDDTNDRKDPDIHLVFNPLSKFAFGGSYYDGAVGPTKVDFIRTGYEAVYKTAPWTLKSEYIIGRDGTLHKKGWYVTLLRQLTKSGLQLAARYDRYDPNTDADDNALKTLTAGFNWFLDEKGYSKWQLNYERRREEGAQIANDRLMAQFQAGF